MEAPILHPGLLDEYHPNPKQPQKTHVDEDVDPQGEGEGYHHQELDLHPLGSTHCSRYLARTQV